MLKRDVPELYCLDVEAMRDSLVRAVERRCRLEPLTRPSQIMHLRQEFPPSAHLQSSNYHQVAFPSRK